MKKILLLIISFGLLSSSTLSNYNKTNVTLIKCVDGDTAHFNVDGKTKSVRFLAIDSPEYTTKKEPYGKEASEFTCDILKSANKIELEFDANSDVSDRYGRLLAWVWVDDELLQKLIVKEGLAEVAYLYGDYKYTNVLKLTEHYAKFKKINMWHNSSSFSYEDITLITVIIFIGAVIVVIIKKRSNLND